MEIRRRQDRRQERQQQAGPPQAATSSPQDAYYRAVSTCLQRTRLYGQLRACGRQLGSDIAQSYSSAADGQPTPVTAPHLSRRNTTRRQQRVNTLTGQCFFFRGGNIGCRLRDYLIDLSGRGQRRAVDSVHKGSGFDVHDIFRFRLGCGKKFLEPSDMEITLYNGLLTLWLLSSQLFWTLSESC